MSQYKKPCLDSSVFIGGLNREIANGIKRGVIFDYLIECARNGDFRIYIASALIAEVYKPVRPGLISSGPSLDAFLSLLDEDIIEPIELDRETALLANSLCRQHGGKLRPFDAIHLACATAARCDYLLSWDGPLSRISHNTVKIEAPTIDRAFVWASAEATPDEEAAWQLANPRYKKHTSPFYEHGVREPEE